MNLVRGGVSGKRALWCAVLGACASLAGCGATERGGEDPWPLWQEDTAWLDEFSRLAAQAPADADCADLRGPTLVGRFCRSMPGVDPHGPAQNGFMMLHPADAPDFPIYRWVGMNFEHIYNGRAQDDHRNSYTPRSATSHLIPHSPSSATLYWPGPGLGWPAACAVTAEMAGPEAVDLDVRMAFHEAVRGPVGFMWASYMRAAGQEIHYWGHGADDPAPGTPGWRAFAMPRKPDLEAYSSAYGAVLGYRRVGQASDEWSGNSSFNMYLNDRACYLLPVFYGHLLAGPDAGSERRHVYVMMFNTAPPIRFANFHFAPGDTSPAWDWQYLVEDPQPGRTYRYRARILVLAPEQEDRVLEHYTAWLKDASGAGPSLRIDADPPEAGAIVPPQCNGAYPPGESVHFGAEARPGWRFQHWEGPVEDAQHPYTWTRMDEPREITAKFVRTGAGD
jgi:hypothetical protein